MRTVVRRVIQLLVVLIVVTFFTSILTSLLPGDPVTTIAPFSSVQQRAQIRDQLGLNENVVERYGTWLGHFLTGDMGREYGGTDVQGLSVWGQVKTSLPRSLLLMLYVQILTLLIAVPLGVFTAYRAGKMSDDIANGVGFALVSIPVFVAATLMILLLSVNHHWLPSEGWVSFGTSPVQHFKHLLMPVIALTIGQVAIYARLLRSDMVATLQEDYILMAKSKGIVQPTDPVAARPAALEPHAAHRRRPERRDADQRRTDRRGHLPPERHRRRRSRAPSPVGSTSRSRTTSPSSRSCYVLVNFAVDALYRVLDPRIRGARIG